MGMKRGHILPTKLLRKLREPAESPSPFRSAFEHSLTGIAIMAPDGRFLQVNPALCQLFGYQAAEMLATPFQQLTHPDDRKRLYQQSQALLDGHGDHFEMEKRYLHRDGHPFWALLRSTLVRDAGGQPGFFVANVQSIDPQRMALAALQESEEKYRTLTEQSLQGIFIADAEGLTYVNNQLVELTGYSREELLTMGMAKLLSTLLLADDRAGVQARWLQRLGGAELPQGFEYRIMRRNGDTRWVKVYSRPIRVGGKRLLQTTLVDLTEHKQAEAALQEARDQLETRVQERTAELEAANQEVRRFAYMISHDLRAPLVNLQGFAAELQEELALVREAIEPLLPQLEPSLRAQVVAGLDTEVPDALGFIRTSVQRMDQMISAVMARARLEHAQLDLEPVAAGEVVQEVVASLRHQMGERNIRVTVGELPTVMADRLSLEQIFANLLSNAVNYLVPERPGEIEVQAEHGATETTFLVRDNGRGIAREDTERVFDLFRRVGPQSSSGEGIGLSYVQAIVRRHGGRIWCRSVLGEGSDFRFTLPHPTEPLST